MLLRSRGGDVLQVFMERSGPSSCAQGREELACRIKRGVCSAEGPRPGPCPHPERGEPLTNTVRYPSHGHGKSLPPFPRQLGLPPAHVTSSGIFPLPGQTSVEPLLCGPETGAPSSAAGLPGPRSLMTLGPRWLQSDRSRAGRPPPPGETLGPPGTGDALSGVRRGSGLGEPAPLPVSHDDPGQ
ncbi:basic proline-rich protein-like [Suricata suricatta]|uniref:basic proline-rich protein-like n=1 Tax=Suricata suricatta TaxID=37032 RepID=UPI001155B4F6|nr:basic proline-rich protein-like [Suricata suricatta]